MTPAELAGNLVAYAVQLACVVAAAGVLEAAFPTDRPRARLVYWNGILAFSLLLPLLQPWVPRPGWEPAAVRAPRGAVLAETPPEPRFDGASILLGGLAAGAAFCGLRLLLGLAKLRRLRARAQRLPASASGWAECPAELRLSTEIASPVTFGARHPVILLPDAFHELDEDGRRGVVGHELVHVERGHWLAQVMEELLRAALWFHPAFHWLLARIRLAREQSVDAEVVRRLGRREPYLEALVRLAASRRGRPLVPAPSFFFARSHLAERVELLLKEKPMPTHRVLLSLVSSAATVGAIALAATTLAPLHAAPRDEAAEVEVAPPPPPPPPPAAPALAPLPPLPPLPPDAITAPRAPRPPRPPRARADVPAPPEPPRSHESLDAMRRDLEEERARLQASRAALDEARRQLQEEVHRLRDQIAMQKAHEQAARDQAHEMARNAALQQKDVARITAEATAQAHREIQKAAEEMARHRAEMAGQTARQQKDIARIAAKAAAEARREIQRVAAEMARHRAETAREDAAPETHDEEGADPDRKHHGEPPPADDK